MQAKINLDSQEVMASPQKKKMEYGYYQTLGVKVTATTQEIKAAYRKLVLQYHPDKNSRIKDSSIFVEIQKAYNTLKDPVLRAQYDASYRQVSAEADSAHFIERNVLYIRGGRHEAYSRVIAYLIAILLPISFGTSAYFINDELHHRTEPLLHDVYASIFSVYYTLALLTEYSMAAAASSMTGFGIPSFSHTSYLRRFSNVFFFPDLHYEWIFDNYMHSMDLYSFIPSDYTANPSSFFSTSTSIPATIPTPLSLNQKILDDLKFDGEIPEKFVCALSTQIMTDPVNNPALGLPDVEREWICTEIKRRGLNPFNNQPLSEEDLIANTELKTEIDNFVENIKHQNDLESAVVVYKK